MSSEGGYKLSKLGCIRPDEQGKWWFMNQREKGWSSFGICYPDLRSLEQREHVRLLQTTVHFDQWGRWYEFYKEVGQYWGW